MTRNYSTFMIARLLQVDPGSVANWIDQGLLKAHRTPGGHRRVGQADLREFLVAHQMPLPDELQTDRQRVLVIDSEPAVAQSIRQAIESARPNCEIFEAHDSFRAGAMLANFKPSLVVLDLKMPGLDGFDICRLIKSQPETKDVRVVATSPQAKEKKEILHCGASACVRKPIDISMLVKELQALL